MNELLKKFRREKFLKLNEKKNIYILKYMYDF